MQIHRTGGLSSIDILPSDTSYRSRQIMGEDALHLTFEYQGYLDIPIGSYVTYEGVDYYLLKPQNFTKNGTRNYTYELTLETYAGMMSLYKIVDTEGRVKFPMTGTPYDFLSLIAGTMSEKTGVSWAIGEHIDNETPKLISFDGTSVAEALGMVAETFGTEWSVSGRTITLKKLKVNEDAPLSLSYGKGYGFVPGLGRSNYDNSFSFERLYAQGGERNIDFSKYESKTLHLPKGGTLKYDGTNFDGATGYTYRVDGTGKYITRDDYEVDFHPEDVFTSEESYPKRVGYVKEWIPINRKKNFYDLIDDTIPQTLDYKECMIAGETMTVVFQTGMLAGKEFTVHDYDHDERRFEIVPTEIDGFIMPSEEWYPSIDDTYIVFGCQLPDAYINAYDPSAAEPAKEGAEWDFFKECIKYMWENQEPRFTFTGPLDGRWAESNWSTLNLGSKIVLGGMVHYSDTQFMPSGTDIRIIGIKDYLNRPYAPEIELSNATVKGSIVNELNEYKGEEVTREKRYHDSVDYTYRTFKQAKEMLAMLEGAFDDFTEAITPMSIQTMAALVGTESNQFAILDSQLEDEIDFPLHLVNKLWVVSPCGLKHYTIGVEPNDVVTTPAGRSDVHYLHWTFPETHFDIPDPDYDNEGEEGESVGNSGGSSGSGEVPHVDADVDGHPLEDGLAYYVYAKVGRPQNAAEEESEEESEESEESGNSDVVGAGTFYFSRRPILYDAQPLYYNFLVGILSSASETGVRDFAPVYGYTEILPNRIRTGAIVSQSGMTSLNLTTGILTLNAKSQSPLTGAGLNGNPNIGTHAYDRNIALWLGGPMVDYEQLTPAQKAKIASGTFAEGDTDPQNYAQALLRFDGTGYFAGGKMSIFTQNGEAHVRLNDNVDFGSTTVGAVVAATGMWIVDEAHPVTIDGVTKYPVKLNPNYAGVWTEGYVSAGGIGSNSGGGGGGGGTAVSWGSTTADGCQYLEVENYPAQSHLVALSGHTHSTSEQWLSTALSGKQDTIDGTHKLSANYIDGLGAAAFKGVDTALTGTLTNDNVPTSLAVKTAIDNAIANWFVEVDIDASHKALKLHTDYVGLFAEGWISAGGIGSGSSSGGGTAVSWGSTGGTGYQYLIVENYPQDSHLVALSGHTHSQSEITGLGNTISQLESTIQSGLNTLNTSKADKSITITGTGYLTGGGSLEANRTLDISTTAKGYIDHGEAVYNLFNSLFTVHRNASTQAIESIEANYGFWTQQYLSAGGIGSGGSAGGAAQWTTPTGGTYRELTVEGSAETVALQGHGHSYGEISGLGTAATYAVASSVTQNDTTHLVTGAAVWAAIDALPEPMIFKGSLGTGGTITALPAASGANEGWTYKVITAGTYASQAAQIGDLFISNGSAWIYIPSGDEPTGTVTSVGLSMPTGFSVSSSPITSSGTLTVAFASGYSLLTSTQISTWNAKYDKPSGGIPKTDLASDVQTSLGKADTAIQDISGKADKANISAGTAGTSQPTSGATIAIPYLTMTAQGIVSGYGTHSHSISKSDLGLGSVENTALSTWAGSTNITTLGTITTGVWNGTPIANAFLVNSAITINGASTSLGGSFSTASITSGTAGTASATSGYTLSVPYVTMNQYGIVTAYGTHTHTVNNIPNSSLANSAITIGSTSISLGATASALAGLSKVTSSALSLGGMLSDNTTESVLEWDSTNKAWKITGNFYATGWVSAGGIGTGGGGGGSAVAWKHGTAGRTYDVLVIDGTDTYNVALAGHTHTASEISDLSTYYYNKSSVDSLLSAKADYSDLSGYVPKNGSSTITGTLALANASTGVSPLYFRTNDTYRGCVAYEDGGYGIYLQIASGAYVNLSSDGVFKYYNIYPFLHSGNFVAGTDYVAPNGTVASATQLQTSRTIWGKPFDGTSNVHDSIYLDENCAHYFRSPASDWRGGIYWGTGGSEAMSFIAANSDTCFQFVIGSDIANWTFSTWQSATPKLTIHGYGITTPGSCTVGNGIVHSSYSSSSAHLFTTDGGVVAISSLSVSYADRAGDASTLGGYAISAIVRGANVSAVTNSGIAVTWDTTNQTLAIGVDSSYVMPTTSDVYDWNTAYTWVYNNGSGAEDAISLVKGYYQSANANKVLATPNGAAGYPDFRSLVDADIPSGIARRQADNDLVAYGNEFNFASASFSGGMWVNYRTASGSTDGSITTYYMGDGAGGYASVTASGFVVNGSSNSNVLLAGGSTKAVSDFAQVGVANTFTATQNVQSVIPTSDNTYDLGSSSYRWSYIHGDYYYANRIISNNSSDYLLRFYAGSNSTLAFQVADTWSQFFGSISPGTTATYDLGSSSARWSAAYVNNVQSQNLYATQSAYIGASIYFTDYSCAFQGKTDASSYSPFFRIWTDSSNGNGDVNVGIMPDSGYSATHQLNLYGSDLNFRTGNYSDTGTTKMTISSSAIHCYVGLYSDDYISAGGIGSSSDLRLKTNLREVKLTVADIAEAPAVEFEWVKNFKTGAGSVAQYWQKYLPHNVIADANGLLTMEYGNIALLSAITIARKVESNTEKIARLEARVKELENQLYNN